MAGKGRKKWWYDIAGLGLICIVLLAIDYITSGSITWSIWPILGIVVVGIGYKLLDRFGRE